MENEIKRLKQELDKKKNKRFSNVNIMDYLVIICIVTVIAFVVVNLYYYYIIFNIKIPLLLIINLIPKYPKKNITSKKKEINKIRIGYDMNPVSWT